MSPPRNVSRAGTTARYDDRNEGQLGDVLFEDNRTVIAVFGSKCDRGGAGKPVALPAASEPGSGANLLADSVRRAMTRLPAAPPDTMVTLARSFVTAGRDRPPPGPSVMATRPADVQALAFHLYAAEIPCGPPTADARLHPAGAPQPGSPLEARVAPGVAPLNILPHVRFAAQLGPDHPLRGRPGSGTVTARRRAVSDGGRPLAFCRRCSRATCLTVSRSIWQSYSAKTCHLGLLARLGSHQLESQTGLVVILVQTPSRSLATAGGSSPVHAQSSNFSPGTSPSWSPTFSPE